MQVVHEMCMAIVLESMEFLTIIILTVLSMQVDLLVLSGFLNIGVIYVD